MVKVGLIGYGSMGSMFVERFISAGKVKADEIIVSTRTKSKLEAITSKCKNVLIARDNCDVVNRAKHVFLCVKPYQVKEVLAEIKGSITPETHLISANSFVTIENIESYTGAKVTKLSPSLASEVGEGISLVCHGRKVTTDEAYFIEDLLSGIGKVKLISESEFEIADKLTSCGPGLIAAIFDEFVKSAAASGSPISREIAEQLILQTLLGTTRLFAEKGMGFGDMISRVATGGGITEAGMKVLRAGLPPVFDEMFSSSIRRSRQISETVNNEFGVEG